MTAAEFPTRFDSTLDLARLPWFEVQGGNRLVVAEDARDEEFAAKYPNTYFELSCLGLSALRRVLDTVPADRILYGTDWPFYHQALTLARLLIATDGAPALRRAALHDNAARLLGVGAPAHDPTASPTS